MTTDYDLDRALRASLETHAAEAAERLRASADDYWQALYWRWSARCSRAQAAYSPAQVGLPSYKELCRAVYGDMLEVPA